MLDKHTYNLKEIEQAQLDTRSLIETYRKRQEYDMDKRMHEENEYRAKINNTMTDFVTKMALTIKEVKTCSVVVK